MEITYHYPPELLQLLIEGIPRLCPRKRDLFLFFRGAGLETALLADLERRVSHDRDSINKYEIARTVLQRLNERGEATLRERREVLKRVVEFEDFSTCWPGDQLKAKGLVAEISRVVNVKDSFTRMRQEREAERQRHLQEKQAELQRREKRSAKIGEVKRDLGRLFASPDPHARGLAAEDVFNRLFAAYDILIRESFRRTSEKSGRVLEQIDGVIELDGQIYLVEVKWLAEPVGVEDVSRHLVRIFSRNSSRGIFISVTNYTEGSIHTCRDALAKSVVVLCSVEEIVYLLEREGDLTKFFKRKVHAAIVDKNPFHAGH